MSFMYLLINFLIGVLATIVGFLLQSLGIDNTALVLVICILSVVLGTCFLYYKTFGSFKDVGVLNVFNNQKNASKSILNDIEKSDFLHVLAMKGESFSDLDNDLSKHLYNAKLKHRYLISSLQNPHLIKRGTELNIDMVKSISQSLANFEKAQIKNTNIEIRRHHEVIRFRIILLSNCLYLSFQAAGVLGRNSRVLKIDKNSSMYSCFNSLFNDLWVKYVSTA